MESTVSDQVKCPNCGAKYVIGAAQDGVIECEYCFAKFTVPKAGTSPVTLSFLRMGEHDLDVCQFDDAYSGFTKAAENDPNEPEAWWGIALAEHKVQYIKDKVYDRMQPICHEINEKRFSENKHYLRALQFATEQQRAEYQRRAEEIDDIREKFYRMEQEGLAFDCFLCVKVSAEDGSGVTEDSKDADYIYNFLQDNGYKPFFSERTIRNKTGADYEAMILYGLYKSETMIVVCRNEEYLKTPWVQNEYTRFLKLVNDEEKESDSITIAYFKKPIGTLPGKNGKIQGIDLSLRDAYPRILKFVETHTPAARERRERERKEREREAEEIKRQLDEQKRFREELEERLQKINTAPAGSSVGAMVTVQSLLKRATQELEFGNTEQAGKYFEEALNADPENCDALWGMFLIDFRVKNESELFSGLTSGRYDKITQNKHFSLALRYSNGREARGIIERINVFVAGLREPEKWWQLFLEEMGVKDEGEILAAITSAKLGKIRRSRNYNLAQEFKNEAFGGRIDAFEEALASPDVAYRLFLEKFGAADESQIISKINAPLLHEIEEDECYQNVCKNASGELAERISAFTQQIRSAELWWRMFLGDLQSRTATEALTKIPLREMDKTRENKNFLNAKRFAEGAIKEQIDWFEQTLISPEHWWEVFLKDILADGGRMERFFSAITETQWKEIQENDNYQYVKANATGDLRHVFTEFENRLNSAKLWWSRMLADFEVSSEETLLASFSISMYEKILKNQYYRMTEKLLDADAEVKGKFSRLMEGLTVQKLANEQSLQQWAALLKKYNCATENDLYQLQKSVVFDEEFVKAKSCAIESQDRMLIYKIETVEKNQPVAARQNLNASIAAKVGRYVIMTLRAIVLCLPMALECVFIAYLAKLISEAEDLWFLNVDMIGGGRYYYGEAIMNCCKAIDGFAFLLVGDYALQSLITFSVLMGLGVLQQIIAMVGGYHKKKVTNPVSFMLIQFFAFLLLLGQQFIYVEFGPDDVKSWGLVAVVLLGPVGLCIKEYICPKKIRLKKRCYSFAVYVPMFLVSCVYMLASIALYIHASDFDLTLNGIDGQLILLALCGLGLLASLIKWRPKWMLSVLVCILQIGAVIMLFFA